VQKAKKSVPTKQAVNNIYIQLRTKFIHCWNSIALKCMTNCKLSVTCNKWIYVYVCIKCDKLSGVVGYSSYLYWFHQKETVPSCQILVFLVVA